MHEENLTQFSLKAADALDALWGVMADQLSATENMADTERTLKRYIELMQRIGEAADNTRMTGLQSACAMVEANLEEIQHEGRVLTHAELDLLTTWPEFFLGFVMSQGDSSAGEAMVQHLAQPGWALPLSEADAAVLRHMLFEMPETALLGGAPESATYIMQTPGGNAGEAAEQGIGTEPVLAAEVQFVEGEMLAMLSKEFALMVGSLHEDLASVMSTQLDAGGKHAALQNYSEILGRLGAAAESVGLIALGAVFARLVQSLSAITTEMSHEQ